MRARFWGVVAMLAVVGCVVFVSSCGTKELSEADITAAIAKWVEEFQPSALSKEEQVAELRWFADTAKPYRGVKIKSCAEHIKTHSWEADVLAKAFAEITGIQVQHDIIGEGSVVERMQTQMATGTRIYDAYVNDADMVGTHMRKKSCVVLSDYMAGEGKAVTNPRLDLDDFLNLEFGQDYDGKQLQLPDQQFPILYWFRYDLFTDPKLMADFKKRYGYELGVPVTWAAYEDIAEFFTKHVKEIDGKPIWGHLDYGKAGASLGWRFSDAWLSLAGCGDKGLPNGLPVDEWGIRVEDGVPVGCTVERGGALDSPAAVYALAFYIDMIKKYAPSYAAGIQWSEVGPIPGNGEIAQTIYYCGTFSSYPNYTTAGSPVCDKDGNPKWRLAPQPHGKYWEKGMKVGYQDAGAWTLPTNVTGKHRAAAWLWAQFCVSKTVCMKKFMVGHTPIRKSTVFHEYWTEERSKKLGGLLEFFRSPARKLFTDTGLNVPDYALLQEQWWHYISAAITDEKSPEEAMRELAATEDKLLGDLLLPKLSPKLSEPKTRDHWLQQPGAPKPEVSGRGEAITISYDEMIKEWKENELR
ncbi:ABC transporter substrate-binding protein [Verrucomicrobiota bacterium]